MKNFNIPRTEFCYAGDWSFTLNLQTGILKRCYCDFKEYNIFEDVKKPIKFEAIGNNCKNKFCMNSSHFMSLGVIPEIETPSYQELRNRAGANWYSQQMCSFLDSRLYESNREYSIIKKKYINLKFRFEYFFFRGVKKLKRYIKK